MYVINGKTKTLLTDFHVLDKSYDVDDRNETAVIGITVNLRLPFFPMLTYA